MEGNNRQINRYIGSGEGQGVIHYYSLYSGGKRLGAIPEIFTYSIRFSHVTQ